MSVTVRTPGLVLTEHEFQIPLDHAQPSGDTITVFAREVADPDGQDRPFLVFFQGGPGMEAPRPTRHPSSPGWLDRALRDYRVLLLDQRGTGLSTPVGGILGNADRNAGRNPDPSTNGNTAEGASSKNNPQTPAEQAEYLTHFRADSIVRDAEWIRTALGVKQWSILGQSFGGFCALTYLSLAPESLTAAFITGGIPPLGLHPDKIYEATFERMLERNRRYYQRYPGDRQRVAAIHEKLGKTKLQLPNGDLLTARRFRQLGQMLGMSDGPEHLHYLLERPIESAAFGHDVESALPFARNPIYAVLHESSYADGHATNWSASRMQPAEFDQDQTLFTGEHIYPWMLDDYGALNNLKEAANALAKKEWPKLYDPEKLKNNQVPVAAAIYADDAYVDSVFSLQTAEQIPNLRPWLTNEYEHNGLRVAGEHVLGRLIDLARGRA
jgi:pimeloyl-ACP methyl ester carboxylesterase